MWYGNYKIISWQFHEQNYINYIRKTVVKFRTAVSIFNNVNITGELTTQLLIIVVSDWGYWVISKVKLLLEVKMYILTNN